MMSRDMVLDVAGVLLHRLDTVDQLLDEPLDKRDMVDVLGVSRATVDRAVRELEVLNLIEYRDGVYQVTSVGEITADRFFQFMDTVDVAMELQEFLRWVPAAEFDIDLTLLAEAELFLPEPGDPWSMVNHHAQAMEKMDTCRAILPLTGQHAMEAAYERVTDAGASFETVVTPSVAEQFQSTPVYARLIEEMVATGRVHVFVYEGTIPYFLGVFADRIQIGVDENGEPRALLETKNEDVYEWAEDVYQQYKDEAEPVPL
jgi:predicted transcriptional regulator